MGGGRNGIIPGLMLGGIGQGGYWAMPGGAIGGMPSGVVLTAVFSEPLSDSLLAGSSNDAVGPGGIPNLGGGGRRPPPMGGIIPCIGGGCILIIGGGTPPGTIIDGMKPGGGGNIGGITPGGRAGIGGGRTGVLLFSDIVRLFVVVVSAAPAMSPDTVCEFPAAMSSFNLARSFLAILTSSGRESSSKNPPSARSSTFSGILFQGM